MNPFELQTAIKTKLDATSALTALLSNGVDSIRDAVRQDDSFPYLAIYEVASIENDTMTANGIDNLISIHIYSRYRGQLEIKNIMKEVYDALHKQALSLSSGNHVMTTFTSSSSFVEEDGLTRHSQINFKIVTWE